MPKNLPKTFSTPTTPGPILWAARQWRKKLIWQQKCKQPDGADTLNSPKQSRVPLRHTLGRGPSKYFFGKTPTLYLLFLPFHGACCVVRLLGFLVVGLLGCWVVGLLPLSWAKSLRLFLFAELCKLNLCEPKFFHASNWSASGPVMDKHHQQRQQPEDTASCLWGVWAILAKSFQISSQNVSSGCAGRRQATYWKVS